MIIFIIHAIIPHHYLLLNISIIGITKTHYKFFNPWLILICPFKVKIIKMIKRKQRQQRKAKL